MSELLAFVGAAALVIATPGPDTAVTIRSTLMGGRRAGVMTATGVACGQVCWTVAASAGITALLVASEPAFLVVKFVGAGYLIHLGLGALRAALTGRGPAVEVGGSGARRLPSGVAYRQGLISDLGNPKMAAFFTSLLPQFGATASGLSFWLMLCFGLLFCLLTWLWLVLYVAAVDRLGESLRRPAVRRSLEAVTGTVLSRLAYGLPPSAIPSERPSRLGDTSALRASPQQRSGHDANLLTIRVVHPPLELAAVSRRSQTHPSLPRRKREGGATPPSGPSGFWNSSGPGMTAARSRRPLIAHCDRAAGSFRVLACPHLRRLSA